MELLTKKNCKCNVTIGKQDETPSDRSRILIEIISLDTHLPTLYSSEPGGLAPCGWPCGVRCVTGLFYSAVMGDNELPQPTGARPQDLRLAPELRAPDWRFWCLLRVAGARKAANQQLKVRIRQRRQRRPRLVARAPHLSSVRLACRLIAYKGWLIARSVWLSFAFIRVEGPVVIVPRSAIEMTDKCCDILELCAGVVD